MSAFVQVQQLNGQIVVTVDFDQYAEERIGAISPLVHEEYRLVLKMPLGVDYTATQISTVLNALGAATPPSKLIVLNCNTTTMTAIQKAIRGRWK